MTPKNKEPRKRRISETGRRQNRSCDQCRKGKRACDADPDAEHTDGDGHIAACSNCRSVGKKCTFEWLKATQLELSSRRVKRQVEQRKTSKQSKGDSHVVGSGTTASDEASSSSTYLDDSTFSPPTFLDYFSPSSVEYALPSRGLRDHTPCRPLPEDSTLSLSSGNEWLGNDWPRNRTPSLNDAAMTYLSTNVNGREEMEFSDSSFPSSYLEEASEDQTTENIFPPSEICPIETTAPYVRPGQDNVAGFTTGRPHRFHPFVDPSPAAMQQQLTESTNKSFLTDGLLRIYHDSMENALSCWLTERTCPYTAEGSLVGTRLRTEPREYMLREWGPNWSNRIYARVCRLDQVSPAINKRQLSPSEDRAASRALHTAIMSFATQWAQSNRRDFNPPTGASRSEDGSLEFERASMSFDDGARSISSAFDRSIQEILWHQAYQALQDAVEINSFRVIFAHIIFALTQRPLDVERHLQEFHIQQPADPRGARNSHWEDPGLGAIKTTAGSVTLDQLTELEGPPIFLERATRQLHAYRRQLDAVQRLKGADPLSTRDRKTFDMLFWLCIMFDTLSSAMNQRPLVVSDEDSDVARESPWEDSAMDFDELSSVTPESLHGFVSNRESESRLWDMFFWESKQRRHRGEISRWPCSYEEAASTLSDAAPIKVLLFRKVTHLQNLQYRKASPRKMEAAINSALRVHRYWNERYGQFISDCVSNHDRLPPRIQSWYIVLAGHWHLAGMLLADIIEMIDDTKMGLHSQTMFRQSTSLALNLRKQNAYAISDLSKSSFPFYESSFQRASEFHFALNKGALLTEPWTEVLIRSFGKAGYCLVDWLPPKTLLDYTAGWGDGADFDEIKTRCEFCIKALRHLGRKSDMAYLAALLLTSALKERVGESFMVSPLL